LIFRHHYRFRKSTGNNVLETLYVYIKFSDREEIRADGDVCARNRTGQSENVAKIWVSVE
jgi:hypothetical protein